MLAKGPNIMLGYLLADRPNETVAPEGGWHDTGDIVDVDDAGFITIKGRAKRFAKLGGEMISLAAVESMVSSLWPGHNHVVVSLPDPKKGEQLVLVTEKPDGDRKAPRAFQNCGFRAPFSSPRRFRCSARARSITPPRAIWRKPCAPCCRGAADGSTPAHLSIRRRLR